MFARAFIAAALVGAYVEAASACSCLGGLAESQLNRERVVSAAKVVVHARVSWVNSDRSANIEVLETFKGIPPAVEARQSLPSRTA